MKKRIKYPYEFNPNIREKAKQYSTGRIFNRVFTGMLLPIVIFIAILYSGFHLAIADFAVSLNALFFVQIFILALFAILTIIEFVPSFYFSYIREHKYGLSNYKLSGWFKDYFKGLLLEYIIALVTISAVYYLLGNFASWWIYAALFYAAFTFFFHYIFPVIVFPFFYKIKPYTDKLQKKRLLEMVHLAGAKEIRNVVLALESEKSKKANAMFSGLGNTKQIVLFDTLTANFTQAEVETVVAHELGHYVNKDVLRGTLLEIVLAFPTFYIADRGLNLFAPAFGISEISNIASLPLFILIYTLIGLAVTPLEHWYSRRIEAEADLFSLDITKKPNAQISTDKRLADMNLSEIEPHPLVEWYFYDHPSITKRIQMSTEWKRNHKK